MGADGHPYAPADLHLPGFVPLQLSQAQILAPYLTTSLFVLVTVWVISGNATTATCRQACCSPLCASSVSAVGFRHCKLATTSTSTCLCNFPAQKLPKILAFLPDRFRNRVPSQPFPCVNTEAQYDGKLLVLLHSICVILSSCRRWPLVAGWCRRLSKTDRMLMCWWAFTGLTHIIIEGTFVFNPGFFKNESPNYFDEVCMFLPPLPPLSRPCIILLCRNGA